MNRKLHQLFQPSLQLYFVCLVVFALASALFSLPLAALELVVSGDIAADVECNPNQGEYVETVIQKMENNEAVSKMYGVPETVFTRENVTKALEERTY